MATIAELVERGALVVLDVPLDQGEQSWRRIYGLPDFITWLDEVLPALETTVVGGDSRPDEQVDAVFHEYVVGDPLHLDRRFKRLNYTPDLSVWEFKTPDIRIFGWVPERDVFICAYGDLKDTIEVRRSYDRYIAMTSYARQQIDLDEPKAITSREYDDVLSDAD